MDRIADVRYRNLLILLKEAGSAANLSRATGVPAAYISQCKNRALTKTGQPRSVGDSVARKLEAGMQKAQGWMDQSDLDPRERELLEKFRELSDDAQDFALSWVDKLRGLDSEK
jgi:hypothetical protein